MTLLSSLHTLLGTDFLRFQQELSLNSHSLVPWVNEASEQLFHYPGKQLRPMLVLLSAKACGYTGRHAITLAIALELIHMATLLHDDVIDQAALRHNQASGPKLWGNTRAVLMGDFFYSRAFQLMLEAHSWPIMQTLSNVTNHLAEGELLQAAWSHNPALSLETYFHIIDSKTAQLFRAAALMGPLLCAQNPEKEAAFADYGSHLGMAFQLMDDLLDYTAADPAFGKEKGHDLADGKVTLPFIYAFTRAADPLKERLHAALGQGSALQLDALMPIFTQTKALEDTHQRALDHAQKALIALEALQAQGSDEEQAYEGLRMLCRFVLERAF